MPLCDYYLYIRLLHGVVETLQSRMYYIHTYYISCVRVCARACVCRHLHDIICYSSLCRVTLFTIPPGRSISIAVYDFWRDVSELSRTITAREYTDAVPARNNATVE